MFAEQGQVVIKKAVHCQAHAQEGRWCQVKSRWKQGEGGWKVRESSIEVAIIKAVISKWYQNKKPKRNS